MTQHQPTTATPSVESEVTVEVYGRSDAGRDRSKNEDAFLVADLMRPDSIHVMPGPIELGVAGRGILLAVSDGVGGAPAGEVASALTLEVLRSGLANGAASDPAAALVDAIQAANRAVREAAKDPARAGMAATIAAALVCEGEAHVAEVGDSRAYLVRGDEIVQVTRDQTCTQVLVENGTLAPEAAQRSPLAKVILQAIGQETDVDVALHRVPLRRGDRLLLCSDGLTGKVGEDEIRTTLAVAPTLDRACTDLFDLALARGADDDITVVLATVDGIGLPRRAASNLVEVETVHAFAEAAPASLRDAPA